jgi:hypothetical protein
MSSELQSKDILNAATAELQVPFQDNGAFILGNNVLNMKNMIHDGSKINESERIGAAKFQKRSCKPLEYG